jgi:hypothetical protein
VDRRRVVSCELGELSPLVDVVCFFGVVPFYMINTPVGVYSRLKTEGVFSSSKAH